LAARVIVHDDEPRGVMRNCGFSSAIYFGLTQLRCYPLIVPWIKKIKACGLYAELSVAHAQIRFCQR
jgi:hypothetical protein